MERDTEQAVLDDRLVDIGQRQGDALRTVGRVEPRDAEAGPLGDPQAAVGSPREVPRVVEGRGDDAQGERFGANDVAIAGALRGERDGHHRQAARRQTLGGSSRMAIGRIRGSPRWVWGGGRKNAKIINNPYETVRNWGTLPDGRSWGSVSAVHVDVDGKHIWAGDRCGANSCAGSTSIRSSSSIRPARWCRASAQD